MVSLKHRFGWEMLRRFYESFKRSLPYNEAIFTPLAPDDHDRGRHCEACLLVQILLIVPL